MLFLGEEPTADKLLGGVVILLGVAIITIRPAAFYK
jgi:drug/metabolite transporter (DMT)-like permease